MKKFLKKNIIIKMVAIVLVAATVMGIAWNESFVKSRASGKETSKNVVVTKGDDLGTDIELTEDEVLSDGTIKTTIHKKDGTMVVTLVKDTMITVINYDAQGNVISEENMDVNSFLNYNDSEDIGNEVSGEDMGDLNDICDYDEEDPDYDEDIEEDEDDVTRGGKITWHKKYKEGWSNSNNFWYRTGTKNKKISYLKIGSKATYTINYTKLSDKKQDKCDEYKKAVRTARTAANAFATGVAIFTASAVTLIIASIVAGFSAAAIVKKVQDVCGISIGGSGFQIIASGITANTARDDAYDAYLIIRTYGKKA